jgi:hypothetical protein
MIKMYEGTVQQPNLIGMDDEDTTIANVFCFGALAHLWTKQAVQSTMIYRIIPICFAGQEALSIRREKTSDFSDFSDI